MAKTANNVIVDQACRLHVRIHDRTAHELEAALLEVFAQRIGFRRSRWYVTVFLEAALDRLAADEVPDVFAETTEFLLHGQEGPGIADRRPNLESISDNARVE